MPSSDLQITFSTFVLSLATTAAVHFGDLADPSGAKQPTDLTAASQMIEILAMLQEKTRGNLSPEEKRLLDEVLYELRLRFIAAEKGENPKVEP